MRIPIGEAIRGKDVRPRNSGREVRFVFPGSKPSRTSSKSISLSQAEREDVGIGAQVEPDPVALLHGLVTEMLMKWS